MIAPARVDVIGSQICTCDMDAALRLLDERTRGSEGGYVCFTNAHVSVTGRRDEEVRAITNGSFMSLADGKPVYWLGRAKGYRDIGHVPGPDFFVEALKRFPHAGHFFYGGRPEVLPRLLEEARRISPSVRICGSLSPPFRNLTDEEREQHLRTIRQSGAAVVWVGLGVPKQEKWMAESWRDLTPAVLLGVGAAFDFYGGSVKRAPVLLNRMGLEWLYRLMQEPRRLWRRYLTTNTLFIFYGIRDWVGFRRPLQK